MILFELLGRAWCEPETGNEQAAQSAAALSGCVWRATRRRTRC
ncbi:MAG: hypothetical protein ACLUMK_15055 [Christensenellales bacterium]